VPIDFAHRAVRALLAAAVLAVSVPGAGLGADAAGSPGLRRIVKSGVLRVGMSGGQPPLNVRDKDGAIIGLEPDLAGILARSIGVEARLVAKPFSQLLPALEAGEVDIVMSGLTITPERNLRFAFVGPYFVSGKAILTNSKALAQANGAADIDDPKIKLAALEGSTSQQFVESFVPKAQLVTTRDYDQAVDLVIRDEVDALVADYPICVLSVFRHPGKGLATLVSPLTVEPIGVALPPDDPLLLNLIQNYFNLLEETGTLTQLKGKWFGDGSWISRLP
jgi:polar amino acid transport system substrate-binding protein